MEVKDNVVHSDVTGIDYNPFTSVRIINIKQSMMYLKNGCKLLDLYVSVSKDDSPVLCFIFDRKESKKYYDLWCNYELN